MTTSAPARTRGTFRRGSIGLRVLAAIGVVVVAFAALQVVYFPRQQIGELDAALDRKAIAIIRLIGYVVAPSLEFDDKQAAIDVFEGAALDPDFLGAVLLSEDMQRTIAAFRPESVPLEGLAAGGASIPARATSGTSMQMIDVGNVRRLVAPVVSQGGQRAFLVVAFSRAGITAEAAEVQRTTLAISATMLLAGLLLAWFLGRSLNGRIEVLVDASERIAHGDLSSAAVPTDAVTAANDDVGRMAVAFKRMVESQRQLVRQLASTGTQLAAAANQLGAAAQQQERGAAEQSTAVTETRKTMESLLASARDIASAAQGVLGNAERGQQNSQVVAERIAALSRQTQRITEILEVIKGIATKSDILALNAALEGTKAGEAGKGFSLVADQIQRLAENVMGAVKDIKELTTDIAGATQSTVLATEESTKLAADTTRSARQITLITQQQQSGTEQVTSAMELVSSIASQAADGSRDAVSSATELRRLTELLQTLVGRFKLGDDTAGAAGAGATGAGAAGAGGGNGSGVGAGVGSGVAAVAGFGGVGGSNVRGGGGRGDAAAG